MTTATLPDSKLCAGLQARAALAGYQLEPMDDGSWILSKWGYVRTLADVAAVEAMLVRVETRVA